MWRIFNGIPRAVRAHFHGPRAATGVCVEEEKADIDFDQFTEHQCAPFSFFKKKDNSLGPQVNWKNADQDEQHWWHRSSCKNDFWEMFHGQHTTFEALTWGAAVVLGIQLSRPRWRDRYLYDGTEHRRNSFLCRVAFALPGVTSKCCINPEKVSSKTATSNDQQAQVSSTSNNLEKVMKEFEQTCSKYTALGKSVLGLQKLETGNTASAIVHLMEASSLGHASSQYNLGLCYETGDGVDQDIDKAKEFYELAGENNHPEALYNLALLQTDDKLKIQLLEKSAELGQCQAQLHLGVHYTESDDNDDIVKAVKYFKMAADQNDPEAQCFLGMCYERGLGVEMNECKAVEMYCKAAQANHDGALYNLAVFNEHGLGGLPQDRVSALELYEKAAKAGSEEAQYKLDEMKNWYDTFDDSMEYSKYVGHIAKTAMIGTTLSPSASSPSITEYVRQHLLQFTFTENLFTDEALEKNDEPEDKKPGHRRARFSIGEDDIDDQDYLSDRQNGLLTLSSLTPTSSCSIMGLSRNSTMPELGYIPCT